MINNFFNQQYNSMIYWANNTPIPKMIDNFTYDLYESDNPFRINYFENGSIENKYLRIGTNAFQTLGAEMYSAYTNPFYLTHKIVNTPQHALDAYKKVNQNYRNFLPKESPAGNGNTTFS